jgi:hypothetical protein
MKHYTVRKTTRGAKPGQCTGCLVHFRFRSFTRELVIDLDCVDDSRSRVPLLLLR